MEGYKLYVRLGLIGLLTVVLLFVMGGQLYYIQIVQGDVHAVQNERTISRNVTIPAARGEILDRYGRPLITNRLSYTLTIDTRRLQAQESPNAVLHELVRLCDTWDTPYLDTLPVTPPPYRYEDMSSEQKSRLTRYLKKLEWDDAETLGADGLMEKLCERFKIDRDSLTPYEQRRVAGIRYEMDLRAQVPAVPPYVFASDIGMGFITEIKERDIPAVEVNTTSIREVRTDFAAHLLGRVGAIFEEDLDVYLERGYARDEIVGVDGAEKAFEEFLHGSAGVRTEETNLSGKVQNVLYTQMPEAGKNVMLTIDIVFQELVERIMERRILGMRENNETLKGKEAEGGAAVVLNVRSGEVLASANYPTFHLQNFLSDYAQMQEDPLRPMLNRAMAGEYEPGSTFKMVTASAALREDVITPLTRILDKGIYTAFPSYQPKCHIYPRTHGSVNVIEALKVSCNYFFYDAGNRTGINKIGEMAAQYGLGLPTGIELAAERVGSVAGEETAAKKGVTWFPGDTLQASIGQSANLFTPLQLANYVATIANGGTRHQAHLLKTVKSYDYNETYYEAPVEVSHVLDLAPEHLETIQQGMRAVTLPGGTAWSTFGSYSIAVAAKTGSVQATNVPNNAVFVAYAPYDDPQIAVAIVVEKGGAGSQIAPIARDILDAWFRLNGEMNEISPENQLLS